MFVFGLQLCQQAGMLGGHVPAFRFVVVDLE